MLPAVRGGYPCQCVGPDELHRPRARALHLGGQELRVFGLPARPTCAVACTAQLPQGHSTVIARASALSSVRGTPGTFASLEGQMVYICKLVSNACVPGRSNTTGQVTCDACAIGAATPLAGQAVCPECAVGRHCLRRHNAPAPSVSRASPRPRSDRALVICARRTKSMAANRAMCAPRATYQGFASKGKCVACPAGSFANTTGKVACFECAPRPGATKVYRAASRIWTAPAGRAVPFVSTKECLVCTKAASSAPTAAWAATWTQAVYDVSALCCGYLCGQGGFHRSACAHHARWAAPRKSRAGWLLPCKTGRTMRAT